MNVEIKLLYKLLDEASEAEGSIESAQSSLHAGEHDLTLSHLDEIKHNIGNISGQLGELIDRARAAGEEPPGSDL